MARVTVEDCLDKIPNRFDLVVLAARRARDLTHGRAPFVERENDKPTVIALREIAEGKIDLDYLNVQAASPVDMLGSPEPDPDHTDTDEALAALLMEDADDDEEDETEGSLGEGHEGDEDDYPAMHDEGDMSPGGPDVPLGVRPEDMLRRDDTWEPKTDRYDYQWKLRLLQSRWRIDKGLEMGTFRGKERGALLAMPEAKETLANYLTPAIRKLVRKEVDGPDQSKGKVYGKPRIYNNLLSSQPLCFNLFGELVEDPDLASRVLGDMSNGRVRKVTKIQFEWSPGRGKERYTGDKSAFDVYVGYEDTEGKCGFLGIEVKYHENLKGSKKETRKIFNDHGDRYKEIAAKMDCFRKEDLGKLGQEPHLQQIWRDHLLTGSHLEVDGFQDGCFVFLYPEVNTACSDAVEEYRQCLSNSGTFDAWTLDDFVACLKRHTDAEWVTLFQNRYLELSRLSR